jgi:ATP-dependent RNA helicase RhlE
LAGTILQDPVRVEVTPVSSTAEIIGQTLYFLDKNNKPNLLFDVLQEQTAQSVLVFTRTKHGADKVAKYLVKNGIKSDAIHGNKSQNHRQRSLNNFKDKTIRVLVATDIAARGIDVEEMELVINYELPNIPETYVHRIGRTGRAGNIGNAISFCDFEEKAYLKDIEKLTKQSIPVVENHPYPMEVFEIIKKERQQRPPKNERHVSKPKPSVEQKVGAAKNKGKKTWFGKRDRY